MIDDAREYAVSECFAANPADAEFSVVPFRMVSLAHFILISFVGLAMQDSGAVGMSRRQSRFW